MVAAILDMDSLFFLTTENLGLGSGSWQAAEIQTSQKHAGRDNFKECKHGYQYKICNKLT